MILFLDETYIKRTNAIDNSVEAGVLIPCIEKAQDMYILPLLGSGLYNELSTQIENNTVSADNAILLNDYIAPALTKWVYYEAIPKLIYKNENTSILKRTAENASTIEFKEMIYLREIATNDAEYRATRLSKFLCANPQTYPLYNNAGNEQDTIHPDKGNSYTTSIYMKNSCFCSGRDNRYK
jgi:hypothetical protein